MEPQGCEQRRWDQPERPNGARGTRDNRRYSRDGSGERAGKRTNFKRAGARESMRARSEFQSLNRESVMETARPRAGATKASRLQQTTDVAVTSVLPKE